MKRRLRHGANGTTRSSGAQPAGWAYNPVVDPLNRKIGELEKMLRERILAFRDRVARRTPGMHIPRVMSNIDDTDLDDAPDAYVGARVRPRHPLGGSAIELPEPAEDLTTEAVGSRRRD